MDLDRHIWEGWVVKDFINNLEIIFPFFKDKLKTKEDVKKWCKENQPYYKKHIPEVFKYFCQKLGIK